jgi:hypothetical protein
MPRNNQVSTKAFALNVQKFIKGQGCSTVHDDQMHRSPRITLVSGRNRIAGLKIEAPQSEITSPRFDGLYNSSYKNLSSDTID